MGLIGSRYYVNHPLWPLERTAANLNFDMVGRLNHGKLVAMDSESSAFLAERILALAPEVWPHGRDPVERRPPQRPRQLPGSLHPRRPFQHRHAQRLPPGHGRGESH